MEDVGVDEVIGRLGRAGLRLCLLAAEDAPGTVTCEVGFKRREMDRSIIRSSVEDGDFVPEFISSLSRARSHLP